MIDLGVSEAAPAPVEAPADGVDEDEVEREAAALAIPDEAELVAEAVPV